jgi:hypothetical protein
MSRLCAPHNATIAPFARGGRSRRRASRRRDGYRARRQGPTPSHDFEGEGLPSVGHEPCTTMIVVAARQRVSRKVIVPVCLGPSTITASPRAPR